jgi:pyruvate formate lyase activating enzyme
MINGLVFDIKKYSIHDGPGIRTTVFLKGCPLRCEWCHNPESMSTEPELSYQLGRCIVCGTCAEVCPEGAIDHSPEGYPVDPRACTLCGDCVEACPAEARELVGREMSVEQLMEEIRKDQLFYEESGGGVTFSGGEPLMQPEFLIACLRACGESGIHRAVDTSGAADAAILQEVARETELFLFDVKLLDTELHRKYTGVSNLTILNNLRALSEAGASVIIRIPLVPGVNDDERNIRETADFVGALENVNRVNLLPFHGAARDKHRRFGLGFKLGEVGSMPEIRLKEITGIFERRGLSVQTGG